MTNPRPDAILEQVLRATPVADALSDRDLLACFIALRDESAFRAVVDRHGPMVLAICRRVLRDDHDAEEAWQATFLVLARRAESVRHGTSLASWLHGVAFRVSSNLRRQIQRRRTREGAVSPEAVAGRGPDPATELTWSEARAVIDEELAGLPERHRAPLVLCYLEGKPCDEAARELGWSLTTFRGRLERGRHRLRARLTRRGLSLTAGLPAAVAELPVISPALVSGTLRVALALAGGGVLGGLVSDQVEALTKEALRAMWMNKWRAMVLVVLTVVVLGGGLAVFGLTAGETRPVENEEVKPAGKEEAPLVYALVQVLRPEQEPGSARAADAEKEHEAFRRTVAALVKTRLVIAAGLLRPDVMGLPVLKGHKDPVAWLEDSLMVDFPNEGDILRVGLRGRETKQLGVIVNAIVQECVNSASTEERKARAAVLAELEKAADQYAHDLEEKRVRLKKYVKELGVDVVPVLRQHWLAELNTASQELRRVRLQRVAVQVRIARLKTRPAERLNVEKLTEEEMVLTEQEKLLSKEREDLLTQVARQNAEPAMLETLQRDIAAAEEAKRQIDRKRESLRVRLRNADRLRILQLAEVPSAAKPKQ
jgi:RNA polymerase sigma factor (sigma-70 family)